MYKGNKYHQLSASCKQLSPVVTFMVTLGGFLLSEDILKAGNYDHPLRKYRKRKYIKPLYSLSTHAQSSMNPRHCEM